MPRKIQAVFMNKAFGDLTIEWDDTNHAAMVEHIAALQKKGVTFHKLDTETTGAIRKKTTPIATPIAGSPSPDTRKLLIKDPDIARIINSGLASLARFAGTVDIKTVGLATAAEAATQDTVAIQPAKAG